MKLFGRPTAVQLDGTTMAVRCDGARAPAGSTVIVFGADGRARRQAAKEHQAVTCRDGESAWCCHAGPYALELVPFAAAPEVGLRLECVIAGPDPLVDRQRFDLFLFSEGGDALTVATFATLVQGALRGALAAGLLELPPCTSLDEWNAFRAGVNELVYTRFGVTVTDCLPVDLGDTVDYAAVLRARAEAAVAPVAQEVPVLAPQPLPMHVADDATALRRLFLELPALSAQLRMLALPAGAFAAHRDLLQRLALAALAVNTMPALALAAPGVPLDATMRERRAAASVAAVAALDEAWSVLARMKQGGFDAARDDAERVVANLEYGLARRRLVAPERMEPAL
jgi:hypothetical protein